MTPSHLEFRPVSSWLQPEIRLVKAVLVYVVMTTLLIFALTLCLCAERSDETTFSLTN